MRLILLVLVCLLNLVGCGNPIKTSEGVVDRVENNIIIVKLSDNSYVYYQCDCYEKDLLVMAKPGISTTIRHGQTRIYFFDKWFKAETSSLQRVKVKPDKLTPVNYDYDEHINNCF